VMRITSWSSSKSRAEIRRPSKSRLGSVDDWSNLARTKIRVCGAYRNVVDGIVVTEYTEFKSSMKG
jgi:hypothetical protein